MVKTFIIPIHPVTKKNSPRFIPRRGHYIIIPSEIYIEFEKAIVPYLYIIKSEMGIIDYPVNVKAIYYRGNKRRIDLTNCHEALHDAMVKSGLLLDDNRDFIAATDGSRVFYDKDNPRIELTITKMNDYKQWKKV